MQWDFLWQEKTKASIILLISRQFANLRRMEAMDTFETDDSNFIGKGF